MMTAILEKLTLYWAYPFVRYALIVGVLIALCSSLLGVTLVLKRFSFIGDGLSHVAFGAMAIAAVLQITSEMPLVMAITIISAVLLLRTGQNAKIRGDAAIAMISAGSLAAGIMIASKTTGMNTDIYSYLFGSILAMSQNDVSLSIVLSAFVIVLFVLFYTKIFAVTFDEGFAKATGTKAGLYNMLIALLTAVTIVLGMRMMGALLISSLIIFPSLTAMRLCKSFKGVTVCSGVIAVFCVFAGISLSFVYSTPTGASIVIMNLTAFVIFSLIKLIKGYLVK